MNKSMDSFECVEFSINVNYITLIERYQRYNSNGIYPIFSIQHSDSIILRHIKINLSYCWDGMKRCKCMEIQKTADFTWNVMRKTQRMQNFDFNSRTPLLQLIHIILSILVDYIKIARMHFETLRFIISFTCILWCNVAHINIHLNSKEASK